MFTLVRSVLLRPLPYERSDRIVFSYDAFPGAGVERAATSVPNYLDRSAFTDVFDSVALYQFGGFRVGQGTGAEGVASLNVTPSFFRVLRATAARGRLFTDAEGTVGQNRVAVLTHSFAARQPGGVDGVVGRDLRLNDERHVVVGVLPEGFHFMNPEVAVWVPLAFTDQQRSENARYSQNHDQIARLKDGVTLEQAQARIDAMNAHLLEQAGSMKSILVNAGYTTRMVAARGRRGAERPAVAAPAVGRRALRPPDRGRQHHEPLARPGERTDEGAGHAPRARGVARPRRAPARDRDDAADGRRAACWAWHWGRGPSTRCRGSGWPTCRASTRCGWTRRWSPSRRSWRWCSA
jgi:hypothetical protein